MDSHRFDTLLAQVDDADSQERIKTALLAAGIKSVAFLKQAVEGHRRGGGVATELLYEEMKDHGITKLEASVLAGLLLEPQGISTLTNATSAKGVVLSPYSFSVVAKDILIKLGYNGVAKIPSATYSSEGRTVPIPQPPQNGKWENEYHFNSFMYPVFASIFQDGMVVNSETTPWLEVNWDSRNDLKPDFFLFPFALSEFLVQVQPNSTYPTQAFYGKPIDNCAFLVEVVLEGKVGTGNITNEQLGQLFRYLAAMSDTDSQHPRGIIYNSSEFIFAEYRANQLYDVLKCQWDMPGAWEVLVSRIRPYDWNTKINVLLTLKSQNWTFGRVLGRGRFGLVCEAFHDSKIYALKIVGSDPDDVAAEFKRLVQCHTNCPDLVVAPTPSSFALIGEGSYYTMDEIGIGEAPLARKVFSLLFQLHAHGIFHGDPRIANVITLSDSTLRWIDFRSATANGRFYEDLKILVESMCEYATKNIQVTELMRSYSNSPSEAKMMEVYEAVKALIGIMHGDLYAHNILIHSSSLLFPNPSLSPSTIHSPYLVDFGAATCYQTYEGVDRSILPLMELVEVRAYSVLFQELLSRTQFQDVNSSKREELQQLCDRSSAMIVTNRPNFQDIMIRLQEVRLS